MGCFRLLLAMLVASSHFEGQFRPVNLGVSAVIAFYFISGYLMTQSFSRFQKTSIRPVLSFYIDRLLRIYPGFIVVLSATFLWFYLTAGMSSYKNMILDVLIIPSNYQNIILGIPQSYLFPPLFSLGAEMQFYLALPLFLSLNRVFRGFVTTSFFVAQMFFLASPFVLHSVPISDLLGYRCFFFSFAAFLLGSTMADWSYGFSKLSGVLGWGIIGICFALFFFVFPDQISYSSDGINKNYYPIKNPEAMNVLLGYMFFVPIAILIVGQKINNKLFLSLNYFLGRLSYPIFLGHFLAIYIVGYVFGKTDINHWYFTQCMTASILIACFLAWMQGLVDSLRYRYRGFGTPLVGAKN